MPPKWTSLSEPETPLPPTDLGKKARSAAIGVIPASKASFKPDLKPSTFNYNLLEQVPHLPGPLDERALYKRLQHSDHISGLLLIEDTEFLVA